MTQHSNQFSVGSNLATSSAMGSDAQMQLMKVLVVDDQRSARRVLSSFLSKQPSFELIEAGTREDALSAVKAQQPDVGLIDLYLDESRAALDGLDVVKALVEQGASAIVVTSSSEMAAIRSAMRMGAYDYIFKDDLSEELVLPLLRSLQEKLVLEAEVQELRAKSSPATDNIVGESDAILSLKKRIRKAAVSPYPVLVTGPTGSGKELVAQSLHALGPNPTSPLQDLNCSAIPESLMESQLFGHRKGAFTGADRDHKGFFETVGSGTLFLDEVGEMPLVLQAKLLRVLETKRFHPIGSKSDLEFKGRVVAATHRDLPKMVADGRFRDDLLFRLNVLELAVPPLADRREDIPLLAAKFLASVTGNLRFSSDALQLLKRHDWPGNVRELRSLIERISVFHDEPTQTIDAEMVKANLSPRRLDDDARDLALRIIRRGTGNLLKAQEDLLVAEAMTLANNNKSEAARLLGVDRRQIERRLKNREHPE